MVSKTLKKVAIIGGGPAGSCAAILLAKSGFYVALYEKDKHPRYHIGESMILSFPLILQLLDLEEDVQRMGALKKGGVYFDWKDRWIINWGADNQYTYHIERSEFDALLLKKAKSLGVEVYEQTSVDEIQFKNNKPVAMSVSHEGKSREVVFDYLIDASGRNALLARKYLFSQKPLNGFKNVALWGYWLKAKEANKLSGFEEIKSRSTEVENPILVSSIPHGWIWAIPLHNKTMSVGCVLNQKYYDQIKKEKDRKELYAEMMQKSDCVAELLEKAILVSKIRTTSDWSYYTTKWAGENYFLIGDAAVFIDPLLSTGVCSAMLSSVMAAICIKELEEKIFDSKEIIQFYSDDYQKRFWRLSFTISALYSIKPGGSQQLFDKTQLLTSNLLTDAKASFSSVISGCEDLKELKLSKLQNLAQKRLQENFADSLNEIPELLEFGDLEFEVDLLKLKLQKSKEKALS